MRPTKEINSLFATEITLRQRASKHKADERLKEASSCERDADTIKAVLTYLDDLEKRVKDPYLTRIGDPR